jgi:hypothetical protein
VRLDHLLSKEQLARTGCVCCLHGREGSLRVQAHFIGECSMVELTGGTLTSSVDH